MRGVGDRQESVAGLMNERFRSGKPDGRNCERKYTHARTLTRWAIEGRIRALRVKRSVRYVSLVRHGDRDQAGHKRAKLCVS